MIQESDWTKPLFSLLAEIFGVSDSPRGYILDDGRSGLIGTINTLSAEVASAAPTPEQATIASHCGHILYLLEFFAAHERGATPAPDWPGSWATRVVNETAWDGLRHALQTTYDELVARLQARQTWPPEAVGAAMMLLAHCAYHVGEIRQRLLWVNG